MTDLQRLVDQAKRSELFTSPHLEADLATFLSEKAGAIRQLAAKAVEQGIQHIYFVGSGGSWSAMYSGAYLVNRFSTVPAEVLTGYDLIHRQPPRLNEKSWVFVASYSGNTEDTVAALRAAKSRKAHTVAITKRRNSTIQQEADEIIDYASTALYIIPLATVYLFALEFARLQGWSEAASVIDELVTLPSLMGRINQHSDQWAYSISEQFTDSTLLYTIAAGPLYGLAYKFALTVFMENVRIHGSVIASDEFRHGPVEMLDRQQADMVFLLGTDDTRAMTQRLLDLVQKRDNVRTIVVDVAEYAHVHPLLAPFVLLVPLEWLVVYLALRAGIHDLDQRIFLGHGILSQSGANWP